MVRMMGFWRKGLVVCVCVCVCAWNVWRRKERHTGHRLENLNDGAYLEDLGVNGSIILKWVLKK